MSEFGIHPSLASNTGKKVVCAGKLRTPYTEEVLCADILSPIAS